MLISIIRNNKRVKSRGCCYTNHWPVQPQPRLWFTARHNTARTLRRARLPGIILIVNVIIINRSVTMATDKSKTHTREREEWKRLAENHVQVTAGWILRQKRVYLCNRPQTRSAWVRLSVCVSNNLVSLGLPHRAACNISRPCVYNNRRSLMSK